MKQTQKVVGLALVLGGVFACSSEMPIGEATGEGTGALGSAGQPPNANGRCDAGLTPCRGTCRDLSSDDANCGSCGNVCGGTDTCSSSVCSTTPSPIAPSPSPPPPPSPPSDGGAGDSGGCDLGKELCDGACVDILFDDANCGACAFECSGGRTCVLGTCVYKKVVARKN